MQVIITNKPNKVIYSWCPSIDENALEQAKLLAEQPFVFRHMALMPDSHWGNVAPIGTVLACKGVIIPSAIGVDISCGLCAMKTSLKVSDFVEAKKEELLHSIERSIPVGFEHNNDKRKNELLEKYGQKIDYLFEKNKGVCNTQTQIFKDLKSDVLSQLSTLGGGNHFLEIQYDQDDNIWAMLHSGSRNIGLKICNTFDDIAGELNKKYYSQVNEKIHFLPANSLEGKDYLVYMNFAVDFAFLNRQAMMHFVAKDISFAFKHMQIQFEPTINISHNFASLENHFGENVWVHRKGATLAKKDTIGIIPGSCGSPSFIVRGLGNPDSYNSCSHGAGRVSGRKEFNRLYNTPEKMKEIEESMKNIIHTKFQKERSYKKSKETGLLDVSEAPQAYKNVEEVMENQKDLVQTTVKLFPIISMKG